MGKSKVQKLPSIKRLPGYLQELKGFRRGGMEVVSTTLLAGRLQLEPIVVRKDLEITGASGSPGVGYKVGELITAIEEFLGWNNTSDIFLVGVGALGTALMGYRGFGEYGLNIVAGFDSDPLKVGTEVHGKMVMGMDSFAKLTRRMKIHMAILCVPGEHAQAAAEMMVEAGIRAIWNFTPESLVLPDSVVVQRVNLAGELAVLSVKLSEKLKEDEL